MGDRWSSHWLGGNGPVTVVHSNALKAELTGRGGALLGTYTELVLKEVKYWHARQPEPPVRGAKSENKCEKKEERRRERRRAVDCATRSSNGP
ncbi:hypothetical protein PAMP_014270 [Pampus punctatissimus]